MPKLSSDRLQRVKASEYEQNISKNIRSTENHFDSNRAKICEEIFVGDWCLFKSEDNNNNCMLGLVLGLAYTCGTTWISMEYSNNFAKIKGNKKNRSLMSLV